MSRAVLLLLLVLPVLLTGCGALSPAAPVKPDPVGMTATSPADTPPATESRPSPAPSPTPLPALPAATASATMRPAATQVPPTPTPAFPRYDGEPLLRDELGIQVHIHHEDLRSLLRYLLDLEVGWVKVQVSWKLYQPEPDRFDPDHFAELDGLIEAAANNQIKVLLSVSKAPEWSRPVTEMDGPPLDYDLYRQFMAHLAQRYQGRVAAYELWNEPNLQREWNGQPLDASAAAALMAAGAIGVREADPQAMVISGAPAVTGINDGLAAIDDRVFLRGLLDAGIAGFVDGVGVHPYGWANPPQSSFLSPDPGVSSHNNHPSFFFADTLADYEALLAEYDAAQQLWATEFGWGTFDQILDDAGEPAAPPLGAEFMALVSEWQQAEYLLRALEMGQSDQSVGPMIIWNLNFGPLLGSDYSESGYSILRPDGEPRTAYRSLRAAKKA